MSYETVVRVEEEAEKVEKVEKAKEIEKVEKVEEIEKKIEEYCHAGQSHKAHS